ncbi:unnamed protein product [Mesocestoides corti]|uniref:PDZ domain-containing protein n=1 Tax=Mesocestoides corti TaxID=53468 RepID=A0A0R3UF87_MESCO|nr:unnamed protein product [Mesocestoides corti]
MHRRNTQKDDDFPVSDYETQTYSHWCNRSLKFHAHPSSSRNVCFSSRPLIPRPPPPPPLDANPVEFPPPPPIRLGQLGQAPDRIIIRVKSGFQCGKWTGVVGAGLGRLKQ